MTHFPTCSVSDIAAKYNVTYRTAWRWIAAKKLPDAYIVKRLPSGRIRLLGHETPHEGKTIIYTRINPKALVHDLEDQILVCEAYCRAKGWIVNRIFRERAPGVGSKRIKLAQIFRNLPDRLVVARPSALSRFDHNFYHHLLERAGCELVVVNQAEERLGGKDAFEDITDAISLTCRKNFGPKKGGYLVDQIKRLAHL